MITNSGECKLQDVYNRLGFTHTLVQTNQHTNMGAQDKQWQMEPAHHGAEISSQVPPPAYNAASVYPSAPFEVS